MGAFGEPGTAGNGCLRAWCALEGRAESRAQTPEQLPDCGHCEQAKGEDAAPGGTRELRRVRTSHGLQGSAAL